MTEETDNLESLREARIAEIWKGDLFERREEAEQLAAFIESVAGRAPLREDKGAYTIAVDSPYGLGKSFFLKRFAQHMGLDHPVAFVDAWADDLADDPLTALAATLKKALQPLAGRKEVESRLRTVLAKSGQVARIASVGLAKRGLGLVITGPAVDAAGEVLSGASEEVKDAVNEAIKEGSGEVVDAFEQAAKIASPSEMMNSRIKEFEEGQNAIRELKLGLEAMVACLENTDKRAPIVIVIDELDRCRPTYAIKLLEEIKHLFDVPGLVFVLAMHGDQLGHSVSGAYGPGFDGRAYLRRFIDRRYTLADSKLENLVDFLCRQKGLTPERFMWPMILNEEGHQEYLSLAKLIAVYMSMYDLTARDAFELTDMMQLADSMMGRDHTVILPYFLPLAVGQMKGLRPGQLPEASWLAPYRYSRKISENDSGGIFEFTKLAKAFQDAVQRSYSEIEQRISHRSHDWADMVVNEDRRYARGANFIRSVTGYPALLTRVGRFSNPSTPTAN